MMGRFLFLGTSASAGVPVVGCQCAVCQSSSPYNQRLRPAGALSLAGKRFLIDIGPDFRQQALRYRIDAPDGLFLTHTHYDHIAGLDELRIFYLRTKRAIPCLLSEESLAELRERYRYLFRPIETAPTLSAQLEFHLLQGDVGESEFLGVKVRHMSYFQGGTKVNGFRFGEFAYVTDIRDFDDSVFAALKGVRKLALSALREEPSLLHLTLDEAVAFSRRVGAEETRLTHISHAVDHERTNRKLPSEVQLAYDGLEMEFHN